MSLTLITPDDLAPIVARLEALEAIGFPPPVPPPPRPQWHIPLSDFNACDDGSESVTPAWEAWLAALQERGRPGAVSRGEFRFDTPPAAITRCVQLVGLSCSDSGSALLKNFGGANYETSLMAFAPGTDGWSVQGFFIKSLVGGGSHIRAWSDNTVIGSQTSFRLSNLTLTAADGACPEHHIHIDGSARSSSSLSKGARVNGMSNVVAFGALGSSIVLKSVAGFWWQGGGVYPAGSTTAYAGSLLVTGTPAVPSSGVRVDIQTCNQLILNYAQASRFTFCSIGAASGVSIQNCDAVQGITIEGPGAGSLAGSWANSQWVY